MRTSDDVLECFYEITEIRVALTDDEAFVEMTRQNMPEKPAIEEDTVVYVDGTAIEKYVRKTFSPWGEWRNPSEKDI